ncbi:hypothetical protein XA68_12216 [Ophiocordyceps unilateralis]|uniref:Uncharacterized protein n=1 Tax=Ophiocordyceps unilateralis TaxID=268505 RepID=A0A2A9PDS6_OPHUN|nr:hypothetical protein XA68_12216 [Ophiocordyceps unilateralis]
MRGLHRQPPHLQASHPYTHTLSLSSRPDYGSGPAKPNTSDQRLTSLSLSVFHQASLQSTPMPGTSLSAASSVRNNYSSKGQ